MKGGILIGVLCIAWTYVIGFTGWYKDPVMSNMFWIVILIEMGVLVWGLKAIGATGATYGGLVKSGTMMSVIGAIIIFCGSYVFTSFVFPQYFEEMRTMQEQVLREAGKSESEIRMVIDAAAAFQTSFFSALLGAISTVVTGLLASLVIAFFFRKKTV